MTRDLSDENVDGRGSVRAEGHRCAYAQEVQSAARRGRGNEMMRLVNIALAIGLLATGAAAQSSGQTEGTVRGVVFTVDASATHAVVPAAKILLDGPIHLEAKSDSEGKFAFNPVPAGSYTITAQASGMTTQLSVTVIAGTVSEVALEMKIQAVV